MACKPCSSSSGKFLGSALSLYKPNCTSKRCDNSQDVIYGGPNLPCSGILTGDNFETVLSKIDQAVCASVGNYSTYNKFCLDDNSPITTEQEFVETISEFVCSLRTEFDTFVNTTFPSYQSSVSSLINGLTNPNITCISASVVSTDTLSQVLTKYCTKFGAIDSALSLSGVNWSQCFSVPTPPTTIAAAFDLIIDQICSIQSSGSGATLPTFNNVGSCLPAPLTSADSLVDTVNKIKTRLCQTPTFDINALTWTCTTKPSNNATDLQAAFQSILSKLDSISQNLPTFDLSDFNVANVDNGNLCLGKLISLAGGTVTDKFVAVDSSDTTPGYLASKLVAGANITLDTTTVPGTMIINSSGGGGADEKVKAFSGDPTPTNFLDEKVEGATGNFGLSIGTANNTVDGKVTFTPNVNMPQFIIGLIETLQENNELFELWCALNSSCPSPCSPPSNIVVEFNDDGPTTTTTTSTTSSSSTSTTSTSSTSSTSTTSTTSTTTTTTTTILDEIYYGTAVTGSVPDESTIIGGSSVFQNALNDVVINWGATSPTPVYYWIAIPNVGATALKTKWEEVLPNAGTMLSPSDLFDVPTIVSVGGVNHYVYITQYATQFTSQNYTFKYS